VVWLCIGVTFAVVFVVLFLLILHARNMYTQFKYVDTSLEQRQQQHNNNNNNNNNNM
jgi:Na+-transporting methylmalonyl-CoA/oxaloacetate decarboxylase gamma subunit